MLNTFRTAAQAFQKHADMHPLAHYTGILSLHAYARLALISANPAVLEDSRRHLLPLVRGESKFQANFTNYYCGGNGTAFLYWQGKLPEAGEVLRQAAEDTLHNARRDEQGIFCMPRAEWSKIWIDVAFAVTPFLLFAGLAFDEDTYIEEAFQQTYKMVQIFDDSANGLLHQARGFTAPGVLSQDHWSRGNGWGILALAELVQYLPTADPRRPEAEAMFTRLANACLNVQDEKGVWHQEMTDAQFIRRNLRHRPDPLCIGCWHREGPAAAGNDIGVSKRSARLQPVHPAGRHRVPHLPRQPQPGRRDDRRLQTDAGGCQRPARLRPGHTGIWSGAQDGYH